MSPSDLQKSNRQRQRAFGAVTALISLVLALLALEVCARFFMPGARDLENLVTRAPGTDSRAYLLKTGARVEFRGDPQAVREPGCLADQCPGHPVRPAVAAESE